MGKLMAKWVLNELTSLNRALVFGLLAEVGVLMWANTSRKLFGPWMLHIGRAPRRRMMSNAAGRAMRLMG